MCLIFWLSSLIDHRQIQPHIFKLMMKQMRDTESLVTHFTLRHLDISSGMPLLPPPPDHRSSIFVARRKIGGNPSCGRVATLSRKANTKNRISQYHRADPKLAGKLSPMKKEGKITLCSKASLNLECVHCANCKIYTGVLILLKLLALRLVGI